VFSPALRYLSLFRRPRGGASTAIRPVRGASNRSQPTHDVALLTVSRVLRAFAFGFSAVLIGVHLQRRGLSSFEIGLAISVALLGAGVSGLGVAQVSGRIGRRRALSLTGILMTLSGIDLAIAQSPWLLLLAGITGMLGSGFDSGPYLAIEQAMLAQATDTDKRNRAFARYSFVGSVGGTVGALTASLGTDLARSAAFYGAFAVAGLVTAVLPNLLSTNVEREIRSPVWANTGKFSGLIALFGLDALAGGFVLPGLVAYWLHVRFGANATELGPVFATSLLLQTASYGVAGRIADKIGLINTMVWTHLPPQLFIILIPFSPTLPIAVILYLANSMMTSMDAPARQAYLVSVVPPSTREGMLAIAGGTRALSQTGSPALTGLAFQFTAFGLPFLVSGGLKIVYLGILYLKFRGVRGDNESAEKPPLMSKRP
jgi:MFS family permease